MTFFLGGSSNLINITKPYSQKKILIKIDPEDSPVFNKLWNNFQFIKII